MTLVSTMNVERDRFRFSYVIERFEDPVIDQILSADGDSVLHNKLRISLNVDRIRQFRHERTNSFEIVLTTGFEGAEGLLDLKDAYPRLVYKNVG